jgi:hypothetical protein
MPTWELQWESMGQFFAPVMAGKNNSTSLRSINGGITEVKEYVSAAIPAGFFLNVKLP